MSKLNRELMEKWVAALRSGKYEQGRKVLCQYDENGNAVAFCCLGVLRNIEPRIEGDERCDELLDEDSLKEFLGVNKNDAFLQLTYAGWNDDEMPFPEIADRLEKEWLNNEENK